MRKFKTVFMRGGTSKGCIFKKEDLPEDRSEWDSIFLQAMGNPDPKQMDGLGGMISSNNKIVVVWKSQEEGVDVEYLVGQVVVGKNQIDYKSNCGNMTSAVGPFAVEEKLVDIKYPITKVHTLNKNTEKYVDITVPIDKDTNSFALEGDCSIDGIDGTAAELMVDFLDPSGAKTGKFLPTGNYRDVLDIDDKKIEVTILDVSNPMVLVKASSIGLKGIETPKEVNSNREVCDLLEKIRGKACVLMGFAKDLDDARNNSPGVPKIGFVAEPQNYIDLTGNEIKVEDMDLVLRVISVFECHNATPLTSANAVCAAATLKDTVVGDVVKSGLKKVRIAHPSGTITLEPTFEGEKLKSVAVQRTARRIMEGVVYIRN